MKGTNELFDGDQTSGFHTPVWLLNTKQQKFSPLANAMETDVLIIGGGVAGIMTAYQLLKSGKDVIIVEDGEIGSGETGRTSAHLTYSLDTQYVDLESRFGAEDARLIAEAHKNAIDWIENIVIQEMIDCHFKHVDGYLFAHPTDKTDIITKEFEVTDSFGLGTDIHDSIPGFAKNNEQRCLHLPKQAQFHILRFLNGLIDAVVRKGGKIYTHSKAMKFEENTVTVNGFEITAQHIVLATNSPIAGPLITHTKQWAYRTYAIAAKIPKGSIESNLWWDTGNQEAPWVQKPYHYARVEEGNDDHDFLIVGGEDHRTGQQDKEEITAKDRYKNLENWAKEHFENVGGIAAHWSGQVINTVDGIGFIGKNPGSENTFIITGDCGNGITNAAIGAQLIPDLILGNENKWAKIFDPERHVLTNVPADYLKEVGNMAAQYLEWLKPGDLDAGYELKPGEGAVLREGMHKIAAFRDENGELHVCTAVCPHLGAIVQWNPDEKTFDCPAHGSRFTAFGKVINGPSYGCLKKK